MNWLCFLDFFKLWLNFDVLVSTQGNQVFYRSNVLINTDLCSHFKIYIRKLYCTRPNVIKAYCYAGL